MSDVIRTKLHKLVGELLAAKGESTAIADGDSLFDSGRLTSLDATKIVIFLEDNFGVNFAKIGFDQTFIESIDAMANLVSQPKTGS